MNTYFDREKLQAHWADYETTVLTGADPDYDYLEDDEYALRIRNPLGMNDLEIEAARELSLFFAGKQLRCAPDEAGFDRLIATADDIMAGRTCVVIIEIDGDWVGSVFMPALEPDNPTAEDVFSRFALPEAFLDRIRSGRSTAHVIYWDASRSRDVALS